MKKSGSLFLFFCFTFQGFSGGIDTLVRKNNRFAFELYAKLNHDKNLFLSPYSISSALAMTYAGAKGTTAVEMKNTLHFSGKPTDFHKAFSKLTIDISALNGKDVQINIANRLFGDKRKKFIPDFVAITRDKYNAPIEQVDFVKQLEKSRLRINKWVEDQTKNKIKDLIKPNVLPDSTKLVLVNAIYFYGDWASQFDKAYTRTGDFYTSAAQKISCDLMYQQTGYMYLENKDFKAIQIPYKGHTMSMEIYLPHKADDLDGFTEKLTHQNYLNWSESFEFEDVKLTLPKFKMTTDFSLETVLREMGIKQAFENTADFSGMTGQKDLKISKVVHKAFVDVSEKGTEAAAATAVIMTTTDSVEPEPKTPKVFKADHPFFFIIRDNTTGSILFMGQLLSPKG